VLLHTNDAREPKLHTYQYIITACQTTFTATSVLLVTRTLCRCSNDTESLLSYGVINIDDDNESVTN